MFLVIDDGMASGLRLEGDRTALGLQVERARGIIDELEPGDFVGLITASSPPRALVVPPSSDHGGVLDLENPNRYTPIHNGFRMAMAAPAKLPEFQGNVHAVLTELCWDKQLGELDKRWGKIKGKSRELGKDKSLSKEQRAEALEKFKGELFTAEELAIREAGISNFGFHYLGSGKVFARIGVAFADALMPVQ